MLALAICASANPLFRPIRTTFEVYRDKKLDYYYDFDLEVAVKNLSLWIEDLIQVKPYQKPINRSDITYFSDYYPPCAGGPANNTDLLVTFYEIIGRPNSVMDRHFDVHIMDRDQDTGRPIRAVIFRILKIPSVQVDGDLLGALFQVLGVSRENMDFWLDPKTGHKYKKHPLTRVESSMTPKTYFLVNTPMAHDYVVRKFKAETVEGVPSGIEMNSEGTRLWGKTYYGEVPSIVPRHIVGNATLTLLESTGWYKVNWGMAEYNSWNDVAFIGEENMPNFAFGPPQLSMPA